MNERLKILRKKLGLTQRAFGDRLSVKDTAISKIEKGENNLTERNVSDICRVFNVNEEWLRTGEGGEGAMFNALDNETVATFVRDCGLDDLSSSILKAYVNLTPMQREEISNFIRRLALVVLDEDVEFVRLCVNTELNERYPLKSEDLENERDREINEIFTNTFPHLGKYATAPVALPTLKSIMDIVPIDSSHDTAASALSLDEQAAAFGKKVAAMAEKQFLLEKKQELQTFSANESVVG